MKRGVCQGTDGTVLLLYLFKRSAIFAARLRPAAVLQAPAIIFCQYRIDAYLVSFGKRFEPGMYDMLYDFWSSVHSVATSSVVCFPQHQLGILSSRK